MLSAPSGWTAVPGCDVSQGTSVHLALFSRVAGSEPASYTVSWTGGNYNAPVLFTGQRVYVPRYILPAVT